MRKSKGHWLQLTVSFDLCDSTHWSPSAPLPTPASLPSPSKPRTTHRNLWKQKVNPQVPMAVLYNWTLEAGQHSPWTSVFSDISGTLFYFRYPTVGAEPGDLVGPYCLISCYLTVVGHDRYLINLWTVKNMLMLTKKIEALFAMIALTSNFSHLMDPPRNQGGCLLENSCARVISVKGSCFSLVGWKTYLLGEKENKNN